MKKFLKTILFLCALSSIAYAEDDAMAILNKKRAEIEKAEKAKAELAKEAKELGISTSEASSLAEIEAMVKTKKAEQAKPKTEAEKLESTRKEALEKLDFYERVVRSVAREEAEVAGYYEIMNDEQPKPAETNEAPVAEEVAPVAETTVQQ